MCSQWMENNYQGDLTDIIRASNCGGRGGGGGAGEAEPWEFPTNYLANPDEDFGDPFTHFGDPLLRDTDAQVSGFLHPSTFFKAGFEEAGGGFPVGKATPEPPCADSPAAQKRLLVQTDGFLTKMDGSDMPISSPRITGTKRRKNQAKKVVCIPAPLPANARSSGEVVPSDLWAWRKYGQKPIKGSPFPRAYYKCSSSKGCSARKQVERSRTDPNMLVITYTSEHNHQWPTQRNALAGSTRYPASRKTQNPMETHETPPSAASASSSSSTVKKESGHQDSTIYNNPTLPGSNHYDNDHLFAESLETLLARGFPSDGEGGGALPNNPFTFFSWNCDHGGDDDLLPHPDAKTG